MKQFPDTSIRQTIRQYIVNGKAIAAVMIGAAAFIAFSYLSL